MMTKPVISIYQDKRRQKDNGTFPIKLRVYYSKNVRHYPTGYELTEKDFALSHLSSKPRNEYKDIKIALAAIEAKANTVIKEVKLFNFERFEAKMYNQKRNLDGIFHYYDNHIAQLEATDRYKTATSYACSMNSLKRYLKDKNLSEASLSFATVDKNFLEEYERWMLKKEYSVTTVGIYLRPLRCLFNIAIEDQEISLDLYPFGKRKYQIPRGNNIKKALDNNMLKKLFEYQFATNKKHVEKARDFWFFSYQCNGINMRDLCELKYKNIQDDTIAFKRSKTRNTTKATSKLIVAPKTKYLDSIIAKYGNSDHDPDNYIFPILTKEMDEREKIRVIQNFIRCINLHVQNLAKEVGIPFKVSTYYARHSFTTNAMRNGANIEYIQDSLGHHSPETTMSYFAGFSNKAKHEVSEKLLDFS